MTKHMTHPMRIGNVLLTLSVCFVLLASAGCTTNHGDFTVLSNKLIRTSDFELSKAERQRGVVGEDVAYIVLIFPTKAQVTMEEAIDDALESGDGDVMTDATVKYTEWYIPFLYGMTKWTVEGDVVKTRKH